MNPYREKATAARAKADRLSAPTAHEAAMAHAFPLGAGYGRKGAEKRIEARVNRAAKAIKAANLARALEAKADRWDRGERDEPKPRTKPTPAPREVIPDNERLFIGNLGGGMMYCDRAIEKNGDYKRLAFLPNKREGIGYDELQWRAQRVPPFLRAAIEQHAAAEKARGEERAAEHQRLLEKERAWKKANGIPA